MSQKNKGFGTLRQTPEGRLRLRAIAALGGQASHANGTAHEWTTEDARRAGQKGGLASAARKRSQLADPVLPVAVSDEQATTPDAGKV